MSRPVITAAEVNQASAGRLVVASDAIVTPLARDVAAERGVTIVRGEKPTPAVGVPSAVPRPAGPAASGGGDDELVARIRTIVTAMLGSGGGGSTAPTAGPARPPVKLSRIGDARPEPFTHPGPPPGMKVATVDVVTGDDASPMAAGYMTITQGSFPWTFTYDEVQIVLEGELQLGGDGGDRIGRPGDIFYVPKGSRITFGTPSWAKFVYVTFPANWEDAT